MSKIKLYNYTTYCSCFVLAKNRKLFTCSALAKLSTWSKWYLKIPRGILASFKTVMGAATPDSNEYFYAVTYKKRFGFYLDWLLLVLNVALFLGLTHIVWDANKGDLIDLPYITISGVFISQVTFFGMILKDGTMTTSNLKSKKYLILLVPTLMISILMYAAPVQDKLTFASVAILLSTTITAIQYGVNTLPEDYIGAFAFLKCFKPYEEHIVKTVRVLKKEAIAPAVNGKRNYCCFDFTWFQFKTKRVLDESAVSDDHLSTVTYKRKFGFYLTWLLLLIFACATVYVLGVGIVDWLEPVDLEYIMDIDDEKYALRRKMFYFINTSLVGISLLSQTIFFGMLLKDKTMSTSNIKSKKYLILLVPIASILAFAFNRINQEKESEYFNLVNLMIVILVLSLITSSFLANEYAIYTIRQDNNGALSFFKCFKPYEVVQDPILPQ